MKNLNIEWQHYDKEGETCTRCNHTGDNLKAAIELIPKTVKINYKETRLESDEMPESNTILINGRKLEDILNATTSENYCDSCSCLAGIGTNCRTVKYDGRVYEDLSTEMILEAIDKLITE